MKCPHCGLHIHEGWQPFNFGTFGSRLWQIQAMECPNCHKALIRLSGSSPVNPGVPIDGPYMCFPKNGLARKAAPEVPATLASDFNEAALVLPISPTASAALSRRCLQGTLREAGFTQKDLAPAIKAAIDSGKLPQGVAENLDAIRNIGNFAAHPLKDTNSGAILPVEDHEAEWTLDVLESLFDHYYVQPALAAARRADLNAKLGRAGKPNMQTTTP